MSFEDHMKECGEHLLYMGAIKKSRFLRICFTCDGDIRVNSHFVTATTLVGHEENMIKINNYTLCKACSIKVEANPIFSPRVVSNGKQ